MSTFQVGTRYDVGPLPYIPEHTTYFPAGAITLAVEYREIDDALLSDAFGAEAHAAQGQSFDDSGVSLHVLDEAGAEYLRFDCFDNDPHYHYITPGSHQSIVAYDAASNGDMLTWALRAIGERTAQMLEHASVPELAAKVDRERVRDALSRLAPFAIDAQHRHRAAHA